MDMAELQMELGFLLARFTTTLGQYPAGTSSTPAWPNRSPGFKRNSRRRRAIEQRNATRVPYSISARRHPAEHQHLVILKNAVEWLLSPASPVLSFTA